MVINGESEKPSTLKTIFGRLKEATGCPKTEVPISARMTSIVQKNGSGKKTLHFTVQKVVSADNKS